MARMIDKATAFQIVEAVKDVCDYNINYITPNGIIFASTDADRVGTYHEIGHKAARDNKVIEVEADDEFTGTNQGVNLPFSYQGEMVAVIGISGKPDEVRKYAFLALKITRLILREHEMGLQSQGEKAQVNEMIRLLIEGKDINGDYFQDFLDKYGIERTKKYAAIVIQLNQRFHPANFSLAEQQIYRTMEQMGVKLYAFYYPGEYVLIVEQAQLKQRRCLLEALADNNEKILKIGIGGSNVIERQNASYAEARIALKSLRENGIAEYGSLDIEILLGEVSESSKRQYLQKTIGTLSEKEREYLTVYFENGQSLKETAEKLFIHKNTLQYQLDKIADLTGYNPRNFEEAAALYIGIRICRQMG